ncbi:MAG: hypothetical protein CMH31_07065 [Micavibrio sp.]|nr:hypothetical protein [Micavibrio sp.]|tara:strand:+ start:889 stop:1260 length:372 start_codon:yes stop_codon:yes gene_type:complete
MTTDYQAPEYPLVIAFRTEAGFDTSPIELRLVGNLSPYPVVGAKNSDVLVLGNITREEFNALGGDKAVKTAIQASVNAIRLHNAFPKAASSKTQAFANELVQPHSEKILETFSNKIAPACSAA